MPRKLPLLLLAILTASSPAAASSSIFVAPISGQEALTRAIETAVLQKVSGANVVTPRALETKLELDIANACKTGDDTACVVDFAQAMGVDYVMRSSLAPVGSDVLLTVSLYDGKRAALLGQGQRKAASADRLLDEVPALVVDVARGAGLAVAIERAKPVPFLAYSEIGAGAFALFASAGVHAFAFLVAEPAYNKAELDRDGARLWELTRPVAIGGPIVGYLGGAALVVVGVLSLPSTEDS